MSVRDKTLQQKEGQLLTDSSLAVVTGIDVTSTGIAASKADVDTRLAAIQASINAIHAVLRRAG